MAMRRQQFACQFQSIFFQSRNPLGADDPAGDQSGRQNQIKHIFQGVKKVDTGILCAIPFDNITVNTIKVI
jgi:hypothetical protein